MKHSAESVTMAIARPSSRGSSNCRCKTDLRAWRRRYGREGLRGGTGQARTLVLSCDCHSRQRPARCELIKLLSNAGAGDHLTQPSRFFDFGILFAWCGFDMSVTRGSARTPALLKCGATIAASSRQDPSRQPDDRFRATLRSAGVRADPVVTDISNPHMPNRMRVGKNLEGIGVGDRPRLHVLTT